MKESVVTASDLHPCQRRLLMEITSDESGLGRTGESVLTKEYRWVEMEVACGGNWV